jgi:adenosylcobalamin-dependent ribonucleoside-triphosphate reductase
MTAIPSTRVNGLVPTGRGAYHEAVVPPKRVYRVPAGMPLSVFRDRYGRKVDGVPQDYAERAREMALGNLALDPSVSQEEVKAFTSYAVAGLMPMSGRHLQHGDHTQVKRNIEVFTNCSTAPFSFLQFYLLLNGSGVGRDYSTESCRVDWDYMPNVRLVLDGGSDDSGDVKKGAHPDFIGAADQFKGCFDTLREARHKYDSESEDVRWFDVRDSREGWSEVIASLETAAFHRNHKESLFIYNFSGVREKFAPIKGMQNRPAQGPLPLMQAIAKMLTIRGCRMKAWKQALFIDHYLAACVVMGDVRRSARMATKWWGDRDAIEFIDIKRGGFLWSANNSVLVDAEFWAQAREPRPSHGRRVFEAIIGAAYYDKTGEPGMINVDQLAQNREGFDKINSTTYLNPKCDLRLHSKTYVMIDNVLSVLKNSKYPFICNPCAEIVLSKMGGYCVIGDVALNNAETTKEAENAVCLTAKALVRTNMMPAVFQSEVDRTNRIGVGITGIFEYAWKHFGLTFQDLIGAYDYVFDAEAHSGELPTSLPFWYHIERLRHMVVSTATNYSRAKGRAVPHTFTTIKPSGTISKVMACTEGAHLPPYRFYLRWVITQKDSSQHLDYIRRGYPVKDVSHQYTNCVVVGFPTKHPILNVIPADKVTLASEVSAEEQYKWVRLLEHFWLGKDNNQVSYTLKYDGDKVSHAEYMAMMLKWQPLVKCCAVMPFTEESAYAYLPEEQIDQATYERLVAALDPSEFEAYDENTLACPGGACPIEQPIHKELAVA